jgi:hypothetical protein
MIQRGRRTRILSTIFRPKILSSIGWVSRQTNEQKPLVKTKKVKYENTGLRTFSTLKLKSSLANSGGKEREAFCL